LNKGTPTRIFGACMGLAAFFIAVLAGLAVDNPADVILARAILAMGASCIIGSILGAVAERAVNDQLSTRARLLAAQAAAPKTKNPDDDEPILV